MKLHEVEGLSERAQEEPPRGDMTNRDKRVDNFVPHDARGKNRKHIKSLRFYLAEDEARPAFQGERRRRRDPIYFSY